MSSSSLHWSTLCLPSPSTCRMGERPEHRLRLPDSIPSGVSGPCYPRRWPRGPTQSMSWCFYARPKVGLESPAFHPTPPNLRLRVSKGCLIMLPSYAFFPSPHRICDCASAPPGDNVSSRSSCPLPSASSAHSLPRRRRMARIRVAALECGVSSGEASSMCRAAAGADPLAGADPVLSASFSLVMLGIISVL